MIVEINGKTANIPEKYVNSVTEKEFVSEMTPRCGGWTRDELREVYRAVKGIGEHKGESQ